MARVQRTLDQQLAELAAQRQKLAARAKALEDRKKTRDLRQRAKAEKLLLQLLLARIDARPEFKAALVDQLDSATLKPEEREAVLALLAPCEPASETSAATPTAGPVLDIAIAHRLER